MLRKFLLFALAIGVFTSMLITDSNNDLSTSSLSAEQENHSVVDYFAKNYRLSSFNDQGKLTYQMTGSELTHFKDPNARLKLTDPQANILTGKWTHWAVHATQAELLDDKAQWGFSGNVRMLKDNERRQPIAITTQQLDYDPASHTLQTRANVTIDYPFGKTHAQGMQIDLNSDKILLSAQVSSHYQTSQFRP